METPGDPVFVIALTVFLLILLVIGEFSRRRTKK